MRNIRPASCVLDCVVLGIGIFAAGCGFDDEEQFSQAESYATVESYTSSTCSTATVIGLSKQITDEVGCANPTSLVKFTIGGNLQIASNAVLPYLSVTAKTDVMAVAATRIVQIESAFRSVAQQYLLYRWKQLGRCGITAAATPGRSNHESGRALDLANYSALISVMSSNGWANDVPADPVHFSHLASPDIRGRDVVAFQRLWNRNHPTDKIAEDGEYGPATESRLRQAPAEGFPAGPLCVPGPIDLDVVSINGQDRASPQTRVHYAITIKNTSTVAWPATTTLQLRAGTSSPLHDVSWASQTVITTLGAPVAAGTMGTIEFDVMTPMIAGDDSLPVFQELALDDGGTKRGDLQLALMVVPGMTGDESSDGSEESDDVSGGSEVTDEMAGGCNAGRNGAWLVLFALVGLLQRRR